ncbi:MAG: FMN-binding protein, partial [Planctomycetota bacterium]
MARTMPMAAEARGYRGITEALIWLNEKEIIQSIELLRSEDTEEHVERVALSTEYLQPFIGRAFDDPPPLGDLDGVSGATLTSLAMVEGIWLRMAAASKDASIKSEGVDIPTSLVFPQDPSLADWQTIDESITGVDPVDGNEVLQRITRGSSASWGLRTGRWSDEIVGYQGPSELLLEFDSEDLFPETRLLRIRLWKSLDNEPYINYLNEDRWFWKSLEGTTIDQLTAQRDEWLDRVEGVSGATFTSLAAAETAVESINSLLDFEYSRAIEELNNASEDEDLSYSTRPRVTVPDVATFAMLASLGLIAGLGMVRRRRLRKFWLIGVIGVLGLWTGNLLSMSTIVAGASGGITWYLAPGLFVLLVIALATPTLARSNPYCSH